MGKDDKKGSGLRMLDNRPKVAEIQKTPEPPKTEEAKQSRVLSEIESLRVEIVALQQGRANLERRLLEAQETIVALRKQILELQAGVVNQEHEKVFDALGLKGKTITLGKNKEGRYEVTEKNGGA